MSDDRAKWDLLLADLKHQQDQMRATRQDMRVRPWQVALASMTAGAALFAAGGAAVLTCTHVTGTTYTCIEDKQAVLTQEQLKAMWRENSKPKNKDER